MVHHWSIFLFFFLLSGLGQAQDERYYRQILTGELPKFSQESEEKELAAKFTVSGGAYQIDLDGDKTEETLEPQKRDGVDWLEIRDFSKRKIFEAKLLAMGAKSAIYKIKLVHINRMVKALIIFLDEGQTAAKRFESTARIFVLSFKNNDLSTMTLSQGPHFFHEREAQREQYWRRDYAVNVYDMDGDGSREIIVQYNHIQRIMKYKANGEWQRY
jgi:hypothetical protein